MNLTEYVDADAADTVHPTGHTYAKMSLSLLEAMTTSDIRSRGSSGSGQRDRPQVDSCTRKSDGGCGRKHHYSETEDSVQPSGPIQIVG
jgi:hypothetical protein